MTEKKFCFMPDETKMVRVFNVNNESLKNYTNIKSTSPDVIFNYCIDNNDKISYFFLNGKEDENALNDENYLKIESLNVIKNLFNTSEIADFDIFLDDNPRIEFTVLYDTNGFLCKKSNLEEWNSRKTIIAYSYILTIYKIFNK